MTERRKADRRHYQSRTQFPLYTKSGEKISYERRLIPTRRLHDITVREISCSDFISEMNS